MNFVWTILPLARFIESLLQRAEERLFHTYPVISDLAVAIPCEQPGGQPNAIPGISQTCHPDPG